MVVQPLKEFLFARPSQSISWVKINLIITNGQKIENNKTNFKCQPLQRTRKLNKDNYFNTTVVNQQSLQNSIDG